MHSRKLSERLVRGGAAMLFPARWNIYGRQAGPIRNVRLLDLGQPDIAIAFPAPDSIGTRDIICQAEIAGIKVVVHEQGAE